MLKKENMKQWLNLIIIAIALYWLVNNILMITERLVLNRFLKSEEEEQNG